MSTLSPSLYYRDNRRLLQFQDGLEENRRVLQQLQDGLQVIKENGRLLLQQLQDDLQVLEENYMRLDTPKATRSDPVYQQSRRENELDEFPHGPTDNISEYRRLFPLILEKKPKEYAECLDHAQRIKMPTRRTQNTPYNQILSTEEIWIRQNSDLSALKSDAERGWFNSLLSDTLALSQRLTPLGRTGRTGRTVVYLGLLLQFTASVHARESCARDIDAPATFCMGDGKVLEHGGQSIYGLMIGMILPMFLKECGGIWRASMKQNRKNPWFLAWLIPLVLVIISLLFLVLGDVHLEGSIGLTTIGQVKLVLGIVACICAAHWPTAAGGGSLNEVQRIADDVENASTKSGCPYCKNPSCSGSCGGTGGGGGGKDFVAE